MMLPAVVSAYPQIDLMHDLGMLGLIQQETILPPDKALEDLPLPVEANEGELSEGFSKSVSETTNLGTLHCGLHVG